MTANDLGPALGMSIGATNLAAVTSDRAVTRKPVLTLFEHRPPEVGVPSENPLLDGYGLAITDFVDRIADPAPIVAADGSEHHADALLGDALRALAYAATGGRTLPQSVGVAYPAHWSPAAVDALSARLHRMPEWSDGTREMSVLSDAEAALVALQADPGLPTAGIIVLCDVGGTGSSISVVDAAKGYQLVAKTVRHADFAGNRIDQALLNYVLERPSHTGSPDDSATSAIGSLPRLRAECRRAKEQLASAITTTVALDLPESPGEIRITRAELDEVLRPALDRFRIVVQETLQHNQIRDADLAAVVLVGGGANIPGVATALSERFGASVITAQRPHLTAAVGAALKATRLRGDAADATALAAAVAPPDTEMTTMLPPLASTSPLALAWSEEPDDGYDITPMRPDEYPSGSYPAPADELGPTSSWSSSSNWEVFNPDVHQNARPITAVWYRRPVVLVLGTALVTLAVGAAIMITLRHTSGGPPVAPPPTVSTTPTTSAPVSESESTQQPTPLPTETTPVPSSPSPSWTPSATTPPPTTTAPPTTTPPTSTSTEPRRFPRLFPRYVPPPPPPPPGG